MDDASIRPPPLVAGPTRERPDEDQMATVRRAVTVEDLERATRPDRASDVPATGRGRPAAWIALGVLSACGFTGLMIVASRGAAGARDRGPSGQREPGGTEGDDKRASTSTASETGELQRAEVWRERGALDDDAAPAGRARRRPQIRPTLDRACPARAAAIEAGYESPRRPPAMAGPHRSSGGRLGSRPSRRSSPPSSTAGPPRDASDAVTEPTPSRISPEKAAAPPGVRWQAPNDSPVLL